MLGGRQEDQELDKDKVTNFLKEQIIFYAKHMVNEESQKIMQDQWINAKINCKPDADKDGI